MNTLLPRVLAAIASGGVMQLSLWLERTLGVNVTDDERQQLTVFVVTLGMVLYAFLHRLISARLNPNDVATTKETK